MRKLVSANVARLFMDKTFWLTVILMMSAQSILSFMLWDEAIPMDIVLFISLQGIGILLSVFFSLFLGAEYSDGTIRNKLIVGHKRSSIFLASFVTGCIAVTVIYLAGVLTGSVLGILFFAAPNSSITQIMIAVLTGWLASISYVSIFNFVGLLSSSKAKTSIVCILIAFILVFAGMYCFLLLSDGQNVIYQFLFEINPVGQTIQTMTIRIPLPLKLVCYSLLLSCSLNGIGVYFFNKKDLK